MKLNIGENIKRLRKEREITQEEFAEMLGVTCQSVSRWENSACYPDVELLPIIAEFFGITLDKLMGVDDVAEKAAVDRYVKDFQKAVSVGDIDECIRVARVGVAEFPNNYTLLNKLMYALFMAGDDDGNIPNWEENREKYDAEIVALGERIMKYCPDMDIRYEATNRLAFHYCEMGRKEQGRAIYETMPTLDHCRELGIWWALEESEELPYVRNLIRRGYGILSHGLYLMEGMVSDEDSVKVMEKWLALDELVTDTDMHLQGWSDTRLHCEFAGALLRVNRVNEALEQLELAVRSAALFDDRPEEFTTDSLLLGKRTYKRTDFDTTDSRPLRQILRETWLSKKEFDSIRDTDAFKAIIEKL